MHYFRYFIALCTIIFLTCNTAIAENWIDVSNDKRILLDTDSINRNYNGVYYTVRYYEEKIKEDIVVTIQSKDEMSGIISTCKFSEYENNKKLANTNTFDNAKSLKKLNPTSLLYNANIKANALMGNDLTNKASAPSAKPSVVAGKSGYPGRPNLSPHSPQSPSGGGGSPGIDAKREPDFGPYMRDLQRRIKMNWDPPKGNESKHVVLLFTIAKDGRLLKCSVLKSSGVPKADAAALNAVKLTAPFRPLPSEFKGQSIDIQFTFDYNVFGSSRNY